MKLSGTARSIIRTPLLLVVAVLALASSATAEVKTVSLPFDASDFVLHPVTGDLLALDVNRDRAVLIRRAALESGKISNPEEVRVGPTACAACLKRYQGDTFFAVVCSQDAFVYLIAADKSFQLHKKIPLTAAGVSLVTASLNPDDPFLYYNYGGGHDSMAGAVDLRKFVDRGPVFDHAMDSAFSANGQYAYRRGPWSPSGFESLVLTGDLQAEKPVFQRVFYDHNSTAPYIPDPFNRYTAAGTNLYTATLERRVASLDFAPLAFSAKLPVIFGLTGTNPNERDPGRPTPLRLRAASYNTFSAVGSPIEVSVNAAKDDGALPRGVAGQSDFKRVARRTRLFVDDAHEQLVFASRSQVTRIPFKDLQLPDEPFLSARLSGPEEVLVGEKYELKLDASDPRVTAAIDTLPDGATYKNGVLSWQPTSEQVGEVNLDVSLKHADLQTTMSLSRRVAYPSVKLPFAATSIVADDRNGRILVWSAVSETDPSRPQRIVPGTGQTRLALLDWTARKLLGTNTVNRPVRSALLAGEQVFLTFADDPAALEVLDAVELKRIKSLIASSPIGSVRATPDTVQLLGEQLVEVFDRTTWKRARVFVASNPAANFPGGDLWSSESGIMVDGVWRDYQDQPLAIVAPYNLPTIGQYDFRHLTTMLGDEPGNRANASPSRGMGRMMATAAVGASSPIPIPGSRATARVSTTSRQVATPGGARLPRLITEVILNISGGDTDRIFLERVTHIGQSTTPVVATLATGTGKVVVLSGDHVYFWSRPKDAADAPAETPLQWNFQQSALLLAADKPTELTHALRGGRPPYHYSLLTPGEGLTLDEATGVIRADMAAMRPFIESQLLQNSPTAFRAREAFSEPQLQQFQADVRTRLNVTVKGAPVAIPIRLRVTDADDRGLTIQYLVLADMPVEPLLTKMQQPARPPAPNAAASPSGAENPRAPQATSADLLREIDRLNKRIDALESRLDLVIKLLTKEEQKK